MNINLSLDFHKILSGLLRGAWSFVLGYDIWTIYKYGGNLSFHPEIINKGAWPAHNVLVEVEHDKENIFTHTYPVLDVLSPQVPYFMYMLTDGNFHTYAMGIKVLTSIRKSRRNRVSGFQYKIDKDGVDITFEYFTKNPRRVIFPLPNV